MSMKSKTNISETRFSACLSILKYCQRLSPPKLLHLEQPNTQGLPPLPRCPPFAHKRPRLVLSLTYRTGPLPGTPHPLLSTLPSSTLSNMPSSSSPLTSSASPNPNVSGTSVCLSIWFIWSLPSATSTGLRGKKAVLHFSLDARSSYNR